MPSADTKTNVAAFALGESRMLAMTVSVKAIATKDAMRLTSLVW